MNQKDTNAGLLAIALLALAIAIGTGLFNSVSNQELRQRIEVLEQKNDTLIIH